MVASFGALGSSARIRRIHPPDAGAEIRAPHPVLKRIGFLLIYVRRPPVLSVARAPARQPTHKHGPKWEVLRSSVLNDGIPTQPIHRAQALQPVGRRLCACR